MGRIVSKGRNRGAGSTGVLTRAKSLALYGVTTTSCYLDLRSRRLEKRLVVSRKKQRGEEKRNPSYLKRSVGASDTTTQRNHSARMEGREENNEKSEPAASDAGRAAREGTPCNLIRDSKLSSPNPPNKHTLKSSTHQTGRPASQRLVPSEREINDLFGKPEELQQKNFTEKYNFDPVMEQPLPGRYEWEKLDPPK